MSKDPTDRTQVLRIDCKTCKGNGYTTSAMGESSCLDCGGSGMLEKEVPYKFDTKGKWEREEVAQVFGIPVEQVVDRGHDAPPIGGVAE